MLFRKIAWLILSVFILTEGVAHTQTNAKKKQKPTTNSAKEWSVIDGFRSAKFGMDEKQVMQAIIKDFKITKNQVRRDVNPREKTRQLVVSLKSLILPDNYSQLVYSLGYKSKRLMRVNIYWGEGVTKEKNADGNLVTAVANLLGPYFNKKRYKKDKYAVKKKFDDGTICVFRGLDKKDRMILFTMKTFKLKKEDKKKTIRLKLSYIQNFKNPDIFLSNGK